VVIFYLLYAAIANRIDKWVWICIGLVIAEGLVLLAFKMFCPLTVIARRYSVSTKNNFDIFLPNWLAKYNKRIYTTIFCIAVIIVVYRMVFG
jgi:spore maturation protein SpmA